LEVFIQGKNEKNEGRKETGGMGSKKYVGLDVSLYLAHNIPPFLHWTTIYRDLGFVMSS
jgi:hypothetical protein